MQFKDKSRSVDGNGIFESDIGAHGS
jgi:hypothetical protein